jgi:hypothetical protein
MANEPEKSKTCKASGKRKLNKAKNHVKQLAARFDELMTDFNKNEYYGMDLPAKERQRLKGVSMKSFNFIEKVFDIARQNPNFTPRHLDVTLLEGKMERMHGLRQLLWTVEQLENAVNDAYRLQTDGCYHDAMRLCENWKRLTQYGTPGADNVYNELKPLLPVKKSVLPKNLAKRKLAKQGLQGN